MFKRGIVHNLKYYTWYYSLMGFIFTIPIWVAFYARIITLEQLAIITAIENIVTLALEVPTGAFADLVGRRISVLLGISMRVAWAVAMPFMDNFTQVLLLSMFGALGETFISGAESALLYDSLKEQGKVDEVSRIYVKLGFYYRAGLILASLTAGWFYSYWYGLPYVMRGVTFALAGLAIYMMVEPKIDSIKFSWKAYFLQIRQGVAELTKSPFVKKLATFYILVAGITWTCLIWFNQPFGYDFGWNPQQMSYLTAAAYLMASLILYFMTSHRSLLNRKRVYIGFPLVMSLALLPGLFVNKYIAIILITLSQVAGSGRFAVLDKYMNKEFSSSNRATSLSTMSMAVSLIVAIIIFLGGKIQGFAGTKIVYTLLGVVSLVFITPLSFSLVREHNKYLERGK